MSSILEPTSEQGYLETTGPSTLHIEQVTKRFLAINKARLDRLCDGFQPKQRQCFNLIPLLFHLHHEGLPGYSPRKTPFKIANYHPSETALRQLQSQIRNRTPRLNYSHRPQLTALYLMGSSGSIGHSTTSDLDIWLCHNDDLSDEETAALTEKSLRITHWAADFNLEVNFFLMDAKRFHGDVKPSITGENCGTTQNVLLLDEFYRTAQLLAGNIPAWWLVPKQHEANYQDTINEFFQQGIIEPGEYNDFGSLASLPAGEFVGGAMWQVYKAIESPYKSILKLMLLEIYAAEFPTIESVAHTLKEAIYSEQIDIEEIDPYIMLYQRIERYLLARNELDRLELVRRCLYFKVAIKLSQETKTQTWRRIRFKQLVDTWQWSTGKLAYLDDKRAWGVVDVLTERKQLVIELTRGYRSLKAFTAKHNADHIMSQEDLAVLNRKLHTAFDRRTGKVDYLQIGSEADLSHENIQLHEHQSRHQPGHYYWEVYNQPITNKPAPLKQTDSLLEALLWSHLNGLLAAHLQLPIYPLQEELSDFELRATLASIRQLIPYPRPLSKDQQDFDNDAYITDISAFINFGRDPLQYLSNKGLNKISARSDSLDFSSKRENLVICIDLVLVNSWGEVVVEHYTGQEALAKALKSITSQLKEQTTQHLPRIETVCHNYTRPKIIASRVKQLFNDALNALYTKNAPENARFVFNVSGQYRIFQPVNNSISSIALPSLEKLLRVLGLQQEQYSPVMFNQLNDGGIQIVKHLYNAHAENTISLAIEAFKNYSLIHLIDEHGSLIQFKQPYNDANAIIKFVQNVQKRQLMRELGDGKAPRVIQCFRARYENEQASIRQLDNQEMQSKEPIVELRVAIDKSRNNDLEYEIICNQKTFSSRQLGQDLFSSLGSYILGFMPSGLTDSIYISDLVMTPSFIAELPFGHDQTKHYIEQKLKLEQKIKDYFF
ncbi:class I adenylate cyclase [Reinekea thalattae]|uniref:Class I adenylate cyclase n=1 Tax=Reinekea thalattae TaxID=2593301 RepID=A0A5C8Z8T0_9GAMM|nr:class I adenylate cyclase [Reinekea thalattae]TXR54342.1 class I adenylate cyclase [Reinekea thalattae]